MNINDLPNDCLLAVFAKLPLHCLLNTAPLVCRRWANLNTEARKGVTSLTLIFGDYFEVNQYMMRSPFHLVNNQRTITETPNLLKMSTIKWAKGKVPAELPKISHLTIVQLSNDRPSETLHPELLSLVAHYAGQLTSFAWHYLNWKTAYSKRPLSLSADFQHLLAIINYQMPTLQHLLLNTDLSIFDTPGGYHLFNERQEYTSQGSLYLPVLRRLVSFSFRAADHLDALHYSLAKFGQPNEALKVRLSVPQLPPFKSVLDNPPLIFCSLYTMNMTKGAQMDGQLWGRDGTSSCRKFLNYLVANGIQMDHFIQVTSAYLFPRLEYLHLSLSEPYYGIQLEPLFTVLTSFPALRSLYLDLGLSLSWKAEDAFEFLPSLPAVTSLTLRWCFDDSDHFGDVLQPARVFPSLQSLTLDYQFGFSRCSSLKCSCTDETGLIDVQSVRNWYLPAVVCIRSVLKLFNLGKRQIVVKFTQLLADDSTKEVTLTTDDL